ncbi:RDD family protein [Candidatus Woesearchaeota archaeon]|nr:RDD family protein [Candidatus Woesearchaeota archaeon]
MIKKKINIWKRVIAYFIDMLIINFVILFPLNKFLPWKNLDLKELFTNSSATKELAIFSLIIALINLLYWILFEFKLHQTIGKMIMRLEIRSLFGKLKFGQVLIRNLTKPFFLALLIDIAYMLLFKSSQRLMEKFSGTYVGEENESK